jgi:hypothetical protein
MTRVTSPATRLTPAESRGFADPPRDGGALLKDPAQGYVSHRNEWDPCSR